VTPDCYHRDLMPPVPSAEESFAKANQDALVDFSYITIMGNRLAGQGHLRGWAEDKGFGNPYLAIEPNQTHPATMHAGRWFIRHNIGVFFASSVDRVTLHSAPLIVLPIGCVNLAPVVTSQFVPPATIKVNVLLQPKLDFIPLTFETTKLLVDRAHYPKDCPACAAPAYESAISGWDCSSSSCRHFKGKT
jgi:hypothetical protein